MTLDRVYRDRTVRVDVAPDGDGHRWSFLLFGRHRGGGPYKDEETAAAIAADIIDRDVGSKGRWDTRPAPVKS